MNALAFLTPGSETAVARSPMEHPARQAGAWFEERDGWNLAVAYPGDERRCVSQTVGFVDRSHIRKFEVHGPAAARWHRITPTRALAVGTSAQVPSATQVPGAIDVTCALAALMLVGPGWRELLARFCAIDAREHALPVGALRPGSVARTPGYLLREDPDRLLVLFGWALGEYMYEVVADAAEHLGGGPVGADAFETIHA